MGYFINAVILQFSGILGAGIFALPYLFAQSNFYFSVLFVVIVVLLISVINIFYSHIIVHTKGDHQLPGYCQIYLGSRFRLLATINILLLAFGALIAYIKLASSSLHLLTPILSPAPASLIIIALVTILFLGRFPFLKIFSRILPSLVLFLTLLLFIYSLEYRLFSFSSHPSQMNFFGALMFALTGFTIIPEVEEILRPSRSRRLLPHASVTGLLVAALTNVLFCYSVITLAGPYLTPDIVSGISQVSPALSQLIAFIVLLVTVNASLNFLQILKETFFRDLGLSLSHSYALALVFPLLSFLFSKVSFIAIISLTGGITIFVSALLICLIRLKISRNPVTIFLAISVLSFLFLGLLSEFV